MINELLTVDFLRVAILVTTLSVAVWYDVMSRKIPDVIWYPGAIAGVGFIVYEGFEAFSEAVISYILIGGLAYLLYYFRVFYGADMRAVALIAILVPTHPEFLDLPLYHTEFFGEITPIEATQSYVLDFNLFVVTQLFGYTVLVNTAFFGLFYVFRNLFRNIARGDFDIRRPLLTSTAIKMKSTEVQDNHVQVVRPTTTDNPIYRGAEYIKNSLVANPDDGDFYRDYMRWNNQHRTFTETVSDITELDEIDVKEFLDSDETEWISEGLEEQEKKRLEQPLENDVVWVTHGIPFIVPLFLGVLSAVVFGNIVYIVL